MSALEKTHLVVVCLWGGVVLTEVVAELLAERGGSVRDVARFHFWVDICVELPLVGAVLVTGAVLLAHAWPPTPLLWVKVVAALVAISANLTCVVLVVGRHRETAGEEAMRRRGRGIVLTGLGVPFALLAAGLGLMAFG